MKFAFALIAAGIIYAVVVDDTAAGSHSAAGCSGEVMLVASSGHRHMTRREARIARRESRRHARAHARHSSYGCSGETHSHGCSGTMQAVRYVAVPVEAAASCSTPVESYVAPAECPNCGR